MPEPAPIGQALLTLSDAACARGGRLLWRGLSLAIYPGQCLHVTGSNGCGKSSLLRLAAGLLPTMAGKVERTTDAGLVDENIALDRDQPVGRAMRFWAELCRADLPVAEAMSATGISHLTDVPVHILSTGQRKRAALARLLIEARPLWLLDEPSNGLDQDGLAILTSLIAVHCRNGGGVLMASHQPLELPDLGTLHLPDYAR